MRTLTLTTCILGALAALPAAEPSQPLAPTEINWNRPDATLGQVAKDFGEKAGVPVEVSSASAESPCALPPLKGVPFWEALQTAADKSGARIVPVSGGRKVELVPRGKSRDVAATSGAFRVAVQQVVGRALLDQGVTYHEVHLLVHWEPRVRVYRIDSAPKIRKATDANGAKLDAVGGGAQILPTNSTSEMKVKLAGLTRDSGRITSLSGNFGVTAADKLLAFKFDSAGKLPAEQKESGVTATLTRVQKKDDTWEIEVEVSYPPGQPVFESFQGEWWLRDNRLLVLPPKGQPIAIDDYEIPSPDNPRPLRAVYRFKEKPGLGDPTQKGWSIVYETPSPLADVTIPFELKDIPLP